MSDLKKITSINFIILFISFVLIHLYVKTTLTHVEQRGYAVLFYLAIEILIQFIINLSISFKYFFIDPKSKEKAKIFLFNALLILIIGFPSCIFSIQFQYK
ncbi:MAG: hypothetical protein U0354_10815 [Candidatus Sericytochromatia bacterium]